MISAGEFRNGVTFETEGNVYQIVEFQHVKPGKGAAFVRTKLKNVMSGAVVEKTFRPTEKFPKAHIDRKDMQYSYNDGDLYYFMDMESFEQLPLTAEQLGDALKFIKEEDMVRILSYKGNVFGVEAPNFVELRVTETEPGFKGDTATGNAGNRRDRKRTALYQRRRCHSCRHPYRRIHGTYLTEKGICYELFIRTGCLPQRACRRHEAG